ncbi:hypothetical protein OVA11_11195 [Caulobacter sp. SL161]|uniref:hypothetical protein n=1 Tax=Caulobacter sp. SL161 TaxID=2995156 RepID=UPI0022744E32|nr:hypothetical protein [Caulobacter sp. SL161]MCY1647602.1 hypothetical protein [Caulobacter sp. SL161]
MLAAKTIEGPIVMKRLLVPFVAPLALLAACEDPASQPTKPPPATQSAAKPAQEGPAPSAVAGFQHDPKLDAFGYYFSETPIRSGDWELSSLHIGALDDFAAWEGGKRTSTYAPIFLEFDNVTSPTAVSELGQTYYTVSIRLLPEAYRVNTREVVYRAKDPKLGEIVFTGAFDLEALAAAKSGEAQGADRPVLRGDLTVGALRLRNIALSYFAGD